MNFTLHLNTTLTFGDDLNKALAIVSVTFY
jgi:hypothetical protein